MLLTWIAEVADEPLVLEPDRPPEEWETNTWWLGPDDGPAPSVAEVVAAFRGTADGIRRRIVDMPYDGPATFYVWRDEQARQLHCSTGSVGPEQLPFGGPYYPTEELEPIVESYLTDQYPGLVRREEGEEVDDEAGGSGAEVRRFPVWVARVGA
ncbi:hypothetical protein [Kitasatospora phosalacinea]|uniref:Uncharacterized protein n=1 Tax=Kitasatospora phosalacinea TaxID=2065 RepID=A0A9W6PQB3_9ACTN|nr:hypothetical protein [Kitasatospora phosalacinea]GLW59044.1 hypothetical protein Kpho01_70540 [Kitasatospora phosalacinea]